MPEKELGFQSAKVARSRDSFQDMVEKATDPFGRAMALALDASMWYLTLEEHYRHYVDCMIKEKANMILEKARPWWVPNRLWKRLFV